MSERVVTPSALPPPCFPRVSRWEDGLLQCDIPRKHMREIVAEDNVSAGKGALLTADVVSHLAWIGRTVGPVLDEVRKALHLAKLRKVSANIALHVSNR